MLLLSLLFHIFLILNTSNKKYTYKDVSNYLFPKFVLKSMGRKSKPTFLEVVGAIWHFN
jgi:hypothetical protein